MPTGFAVFNKSGIFKNFTFLPIISYYLSDTGLLFGLYLNSDDTSDGCYIAIFNQTIEFSYEKHYLKKCLYAESNVYRIFDVHFQPKISKIPSMVV
mmetsp:Transcript_14512/g.12319  ORF Transcript_14512/g.12319 Transcript_14512/m.12319 type:complete len:96 (-) Transcript_14512:745-1032(-)